MLFLREAIKQAQQKRPSTTCGHRRTRSGSPSSHQQRFFLEKFVLFGAAGPDAFWLPRLAVVSFGQECFVLFSIPYYIESSQIAAVEYLRLSACISRGWHQLFIHEEKGRVEKETRNDKTPWSRFSTVSSTFFSSSDRFVCVGFCSRRFWNTRGFGPTSLVVATVSRHDSVRLNIFFFVSLSPFPVRVWRVCCSASSTLFLHLPLSLRNPFRSLHHHHHLLSLIRKKKIRFI